MQQIIFKHLHTGIVNAGFVANNGSVYCGCCGELIPAKDIVVLKTFSKWVDVQAAICADIDISKYIRGAVA